MGGAAGVKTGTPSWSGRHAHGQDYFHGSVVRICIPPFVLNAVFVSSRAYVIISLSRAANAFKYLIFFDEILRRRRRHNALHLTAVSVIIDYFCAHSVPKVIYRRDLNRSLSRKTVYLLILQIVVQLCAVERPLPLFDFKQKRGPTTRDIIL